MTRTAGVLFKLAQRLTPQSVLDSKRGELTNDKASEVGDILRYQARGEHLKQLLAQLDAISVAQLSPGERTNAAVLQTILENEIADVKYREWEMPANSDSNFWTYLDERDTLSDAEAYRRYIARIRDIPRFFDENVANMRAGLARGFTPPHVTLVGRDGSISSFITDKTDFFSTAHGLHQHAGLPVSGVRWVDWYLNNDPLQFRLEQGEYNGDLLDNYHEKMQRLNPGSAKEETGA